MYENQKSDFEERSADFSVDVISFLEDFDNDAQSLIGGDIIRSEEWISYASDEEFDPLNDYDDSYTWTFYTIITSKGTMKLRWYGTSNGYYSESVTLAINHQTIYLN